MPDSAKPAKTEAPSPLKVTPADRTRSRIRRSRNRLTVTTPAKATNEIATTLASVKEESKSTPSSTPKGSLPPSSKSAAPLPCATSSAPPPLRSSRRRQGLPATVTPATPKNKDAVAQSPKDSVETPVKVDTTTPVKAKPLSSLSAQAPAFRSKLATAREPTILLPDSLSEASPKASTGISSGTRNRKFESTVRRVVMQQLGSILGDGGSKANMLSLNSNGDSPSSVNTAIPGRYGGFDDLPEPPKSACSTTSAPLCFEDANAQPANLYINGLPAHTTDEHLLALASRFGNVKSHKAMINKETGLCKGFGFVLYETHDEARSAMLELARLGLQPSWARESFNTTLRRMADLQSANIYLSNLPKDMGSEGLERLVAPHHILSQRILTDANGASRGVGFVRLRDRTLAEECIARLNGKVLPGQVIPLQVRFADSEAQKHLKQANHAAKKAATPPAQAFGSSTLSNGTGLGFTIYDPYSQSMSNLANAPNGFSPMGIASPGMGMFGLQPGSPLIPVGSIPGYSQSAPTYTNFGSPSAGFSLMGGNSFSPSAFANLSSIYPPVSPYSAGSGVTSAATSPDTLHPSGMSSPADAPNKGYGRFKSTSSMPNCRFVPPELAQQHAMALMSSWQAQDALRTFNAATLGNDRLPTVSSTPAPSSARPSAPVPLDTAHGQTIDQHSMPMSATSA